MLDLSTELLKTALFNACDQRVPVDRTLAEQLYRKLYFNRRNLEIFWLPSMEALNAVMPIGAQNYVGFRTIIKGGGVHKGLTCPGLAHMAEYQREAVEFHKRNNYRSGPHSDCMVLARLIYGLLLVPYELTDWGQTLAHVAITCGHHFTLGNRLYASERQVLTVPTWQKPMLDQPSGTGSPTVKR
jgi:hypothetical protein